MEKRLILAIALSLLVMLTWSTLVSKLYHVDSKDVTSKELVTALSAPKHTAVGTTEQNPPSPNPLQYSQNKFELTFTEPIAAIKEIIFPAHQNHKFSLQSGFLTGSPSLSFYKQSSGPDTITFVYKDQEKQIIKKFIFSNTSYSSWLELKVQNLTSSSISLNLPIILGVLDFSPQNVQSRYQDIAVATKDKVLHLNARKNLDFPEVKFLSLRDRYFCAIIEPESGKYNGFIRKITAQKSEIGLNLQELKLEPGQQIVQKFHIYLGPQDLRLINSINPEWSAVIYYGAFDFISQILLRLLEFFYGLVHNWGWAIVIFSFAVYLMLFPLTLKQMRSMKEMQVLQPQIEALRKTYKDNAQKLNKEIMELYRQHKVNPFGGCLPLLLQMPIFFALYQALMRSIALKGASFLWIKDLSEPDRLFILPRSIPVLGNEINILPIVMAIGMLIQQKISTINVSSTTAEQQKMMMIIMPIMFGIIFYHMPSGLVLYWFINSTLMLLYQFRISTSTSLSANSERSRTISRTR